MKQNIFFVNVFYCLQIAFKNLGKRGSFFFLAALIFSNLAAAIEPATQDREVMERAKVKKYRNGAEEGELQVQAQLIKPQRKISPVIDRKDSENSQEHD